MNKNNLIKLFVVFIFIFSLNNCKEKRIIEKIGNNHFVTDLKPFALENIKPNVIFSYSHTLKGPFSQPVFLNTYNNNIIILEKKKKKLIFYNKNSKKKKVFVLDMVQKPNRVIQLKDNLFIIEDTYNSTFYKYSYSPQKKKIIFKKKYINKNIYYLSFYQGKFLAINKELNYSNIVYLNNSLEIIDKFISIESKYITYSCYKDGIIIGDTLNYNLYDYNWKGHLNYQVSLKKKKLISEKGIKFFRSLQFPKSPTITPITAFNKIYLDRNHEGQLRIVLQTNLIDKESSLYYYDIFSQGVLISRIPYSFDILHWDYNFFYFLDKAGDIRCLKMEWKEK